jgi:Ca2+-transporting ATPase
MKQYLEDVQDVLTDLKTSADGLTSGEAARRLTLKGKNKLLEGRKKSLAHRIFDQIRDPMILVLLGAAAVSMATAVWAGESFADVIIILFVVVLNAVLGVVQENKAERAIEALKAMSADSISTLRDGEVMDIASEDLVVGDVIILTAGDAVPADGRLIECSSLKAEEAPLTGESVPVEKTSAVTALPEGAAPSEDVPLGDRSNMVYTGCAIVYGHGRAVVTATAMDTEMGKIAHQIHTAADSRTPLQVKLAQLSRVLTWGVLGICIFIFAFSLIRSGDVTTALVLDTFMLAVSLAVAAIPEGLVAVVTIVLSIGVTRMSRRNAVVRKMTAVETLGCTQVICSDKTGTLTQNKMTVVASHCDNTYSLAQALALCNDATIAADGQITGEPTEAALLEFVRKEGVEKNILSAEMPRLADIPFDSERKMMTTFNAAPDGTIMQFTKGAPDMIMQCCSHMLKDGQVVPLGDEERKELQEINTRLTSKALRVLAAARKELPSLPEDLTSSDREHDLVFVGLAGMIDPIRPEAVIAIEKCKEAGIRPVMITGDHENTAAAIARDLGIIERPEQVLPARELEKLSDEQLADSIEKYAVYTRVQPQHKVRIVQAWKSRGAITAMTGDGVNDAPALKNADIGVAMGITGTDVTRNIADIVLADDNFATIVAAVEEGRRIYDNIRRTIQYLLSSNLSEVLLIFVATLAGFVILNPVQLLWINLVTDMLPALALGMEFAAPDIMRRPPRKPTDGIFAEGLGFACIYQGIIITVLSAISCAVGGTTMTFVTLSMCQAFQAFNMRSLNGSIFKLHSHNWYLYLAFIAALVLTIIPVYIPFMAVAFGLTALSIGEYCSAVALGFAIIPILEVVKYFHFKRHNNR